MAAINDMCSLPEVCHPPSEPEHQTSPSPSPSREQAQAPSSPSPLTAYPAHELSTEPNRSSQEPYSAAEEDKSPKEDIFRMSVSTLIFSAVIALLSIAVIGLAVATGILATRANKNASSAGEGNGGVGAGNENKAPATTTTVTVTVASSTPTSSPSSSSSSSSPSLDNTGCGGGIYRSKLWSDFRYNTICDTEVRSSDDFFYVFTVFANSFEGCLEACANWGNRVPGMFPDEEFSSAAENVTRYRENTRCEAVTWVESWATWSAASQGDNKGNCYLKSGGITQNDVGPSKDDRIAHTGFWIQD